MQWDTPSNGGEGVGVRLGVSQFDAEAHIAELHFHRSIVSQQHIVHLKFQHPHAHVSVSASQGLGFRVEGVVKP